MEVFENRDKQVYPVSGHNHGTGPGTAASRKDLRGEGGGVVLGAGLSVQRSGFLRTRVLKPVTETLVALKQKMLPPIPWQYSEKGERLITPREVISNPITFLRVALIEMRNESFVGRISRLAAQSLLVMGGGLMTINGILISGNGNEVYVGAGIFLTGTILSAEHFVPNYSRRYNKYR